jgi:exodeoxyribonuclease VII large subunit
MMNKMIHLSFSLFVIRNFNALCLMPNKMLKLSELNGLVRQVIMGAFPDKLWIIGEISEMKTNRSGHCYLSLIEKDIDSDAVIAQARATIWSYTYRMLRPYFETTTGQVLREGLKVLVQVSVEFHELYGYSLNIQDIDPTYTLGDLARRKAEIISRLTSEGVFDMNKELEFPFVPQRIAVISSETAAGYLDFTNHLKNNQGGYVFYCTLFPAVMQGEQTESSVIGALEQIYQYENSFDVVVIIRGGGSQFDLSCFDNYNIAYHVTQFPLPVITGIGHEKDNSVVDMVAHTRLKTPTAVAEFLIGAVARFDLRLSEAHSIVVEHIRRHFEEANKQVGRLSRIAGPLVRNRILQNSRSLDQLLWQTSHFIKIALVSHKNELDNKLNEIKRNVPVYLTQESKRLEKTGGSALSGLKSMIPSVKEQLNRNITSLTNILHRKLVNEHHKLEMVSQKVFLSDPALILARGYSYTTYKGRIIKDISLIQKGDTIKTILQNGSILSEVLDKRETAAS